MMSLTGWKQFPWGFRGYVSMTIAGSHSWLCHRHDSSSTSHLGAEQTHVYHTINTMASDILLDLIVLQLKPSRRALQWQSIFETVAD